MWATIGALLVLLAAGKASNPRQNRALRFLSSHESIKVDRAITDSACNKKFLSFAQLHESIALKQASTMASQARVSGCAVLQSKLVVSEYPGGTPDSVSPCNIYDQGRHDKAEDILKVVGDTTVGTRYRATESALCTTLVERLLPSILESDAVTQSKGFPSQTWTAPQIPTQNNVEPAKQKEPTAPEDLNLGSCAKLKRARNKMDKLWQSIVLGSKYVNPGGMSLGDGKNDAGVSSDSIGQDIVGEDTGGDASGLSNPQQVTATPPSGSAQTLSPTGLDGSAQVNSDPSQPEQILHNFRSARSDITAESLEKKIEATESRLEAFDDRDKAKREVQAAALQVAYAQKMTAVRKRAEEQLAASMSLLQVKNHPGEQEQQETGLESSPGGDASESTSSTDCVSSMEQLGSTDYDALRADYDRFKQACDDIQGPLKKYIREELSKPRDQIVPVELREFLSGYAIPSRINEGICNMPDAVNATRLDLD